MTSLETTIQSIIEPCKSRKVEHEKELGDKKSKISILRSEVEGLEAQIKEHELQAITIEKGASDLDKRAADIRETARRRRDNAGLGAFVSAIVGIVFAPFTGKKHFFLFHRSLMF